VAGEASSVTAAALDAEDDDLAEALCPSQKPRVSRPVPNVVGGKH